MRSHRNDMSGARCCVWLLVLLLSSQPAESQVTTRLDQRVVAGIESIFEASTGLDSPGYAVGIIEGGELRYARGFGSANLDHGIPISASSVFNVASLSKQFTAAALGILVVRGQVDLEGDVRTYIPDFPARFGNLQVQHLVYMTSGLPEYYTLERPGGRNWGDDFFTVADAIDAVLSAPELEFEPGTRWAYSNINYQLIAEIVARVSNVSFSEFLRAAVFEPLGMSNTHVNDDLGRVIPGRVTGYNLTDLGAFRQEIRRAPHYGGSGVFTTLEDLVRWDRSFRDESLGGSELTELLLSRRTFDHDKDNDAFGLVWGKYAGRRTLWYEGGDTGFSSYMARFLDDDLTVIVLSNIGTGRAADHARRVLDVLFANPD